MLKLKINLENMYDTTPTKAELQEYDSHLKKANIQFTRRGKTVTFTGTEEQLLEAAFQDHQFWGGPSFSDEDALDFIRENAV